MVEDISLQAILAARQAYEHGPLRQRLAPFHADVDCAFWQWNDVWLSPGFRVSTSAPNWAASVRPCWPSKAKATPTARWPKSTTLPRLCLMRSCSSCPIAATRLTATSPKPWRRLCKPSCNSPCRRPPLRPLNGLEVHEHSRAGARSHKNSVTLSPWEAAPAAEWWWPDTLRAAAQGLSRTRSSSVNQRH
jgi:hypothetical protein